MNYLVILLLPCFTLSHFASFLSRLMRRRILISNPHDFLPCFTRTLSCFAGHSRMPYLPQPAALHYSVKFYVAMKGFKISFGHQRLAIKVECGQRSLKLR